ncbi:unnamed protein product [Periconia digitata]|uniref:Uncharacterized protein n=1 Tax=Periconia digitata TaxID=1303443 RepID=A0A9W4U4L4_9PLEO|nr:unnamed protein product [Periconia digitata]
MFWPRIQNAWNGAVEKHAFADFTRLSHFCKKEADTLITRLCHLLVVCLTLPFIETITTDGTIASARFSMSRSIYFTVTLAPPMSDYLLSNFLHIKTMCS